MMEYDYFLKRDRVYYAVLTSLVMGLFILSASLIWKQYQMRGKPMDPILPMTDEQFIAAGKRFLEYLYSLNASSIEEDYFLLSQMIEARASDKKEARQSWVEETDIIRRVKRSGMKSRIDWDASEYIIKQSIDKAKVIQYRGRYEYKTKHQNEYGSKSFDIEIGLIQAKPTDMTPYGAMVYNWVDYANH